MSEQQMASPPPAKQAPAAKQPPSPPTRPGTPPSNAPAKPGEPSAARAPAKPPIPVPPEAVVAEGEAGPIPEASAEGLGEDEDVPNGHKEIGTVFFFPEGCIEALETVHRKFQEVIKKHKLKFRLKRVHNEPYTVKGKVNYSSFVDVCKNNRVPVAIVIGPPPETHMPEQDFYDLLAVTLDVQGVSLQLVNWGEINKDYRYLNLALDIALVRSR
jgi:hypothetical protein